MQITATARVLAAFGHDQINGPTRLGQHLQQQLGGFAQHRNPAGQIGRVVGQIAADFESITDQDRSEFGHQLFAGIGLAAGSS